MADGTRFGIAHLACLGVALRATLHAHLGNRLFHLVAPMSFGLVPIATPFLLVHSSTDKRPELAMTWH